MTIPPRTTAKTRRGSRLTVTLPPRFRLANAICSYGYFLLAPNRWDPVKKCFYRPFSISGDKFIAARLTQPSASRLSICCDRPVTRDEADVIRLQTRRMLRLDEDLSSWTRSHPEARRRYFDRLFRSPTLFEDIVKTITGCNVSWPNTMRMNRLLCEHIGGGGFPTPHQVARVRVDVLKRRCKVGYRAQRIIDLARAVVRKQLDLGSFERDDISTADIYDSLKTLNGIGPYAAANLCQLLGRYEHVPIDTETYRHFRKQHRVPADIKPKTLDTKINRYYQKFHPHQFLAYWFELWQDYESRYGPATRWAVDEVGAAFTASVLNRKS